MQIGHSSSKVALPVHLQADSGMNSDPSMFLLYSWVYFLIYWGCSALMLQAVPECVALGELSTLSINPHASSPGHGLVWTRGTKVPLFPQFQFCLSSIEVLTTCYLSAGKPWREWGSSTMCLTGFRCRRRHSVARSAVTAFFFCSVENSVCLKGFADYSCPTGCFQSISCTTCPGLLISFERVGISHVQATASN